MPNRHSSPSPGAARAAMALLFCAAAAGARADRTGPEDAPVRSSPPFSVALLGVVSQPAGPSSRGAGAGAAFGYRITDRLNLAVDLARLDSPAGAFTTAGAGLQAVLDSTPISPYLALSLVILGPQAVTQAGLAARTAAGAEVRITRAISVGLEARRLAPLSGSGQAQVSGTEVALRLSLFPSLLRW